jgi:hypothetical protein
MLFSQRFFLVFRVILQIPTWTDASLGTLETVCSSNKPADGQATSCVDRNRPDEYSTDVTLHLSLYVVHSSRALAKNKISWINSLPDAMKRFEH